MRRSSRFADSASRAALVLLACCAARGYGQNASSGPQASRPPSGFSVPRITGELDDLPLPEAARRLGELLSIPFELAEPEGTGAPSLDRSLRARLSWKETPVGDALRQFCRAYHCRLELDEEAGYRIEPGPFPAGPVCRLDGYLVELTEIGFFDRRAASEGGPDEVERDLALEVAVRAASGDPSPICTVENVRVEDQHGRDALGKPDEGQSEDGSPAVSSPFPDERRQYLLFDWPYPAPHRLRRIEGDLVLYRRVRHVTEELEIHSTLPTQPGVAVGDARIQLVRSLPRTPEYPYSRYVVRLLGAADMHLQLAGAIPPAQLVLQDGSRVPLVADAISRGEYNGAPVAEYSLRAQGVEGKPDRLLLRLVLQSQPDRRLRFTFVDYPAEIAPPPAPPAGAPRKPPKKSAPVPRPRPRPRRGP
jgi:hypothetical protein